MKYDIIVIEGAEHDIRDFFTRMGPNINDLIVTLAVGNNALAVLLLDFLNLLMSTIHFHLLFLGNNHVHNPNRNSGTRGFAEAKIL